MLGALKTPSQVGRALNISQEISGSLPVGTYTDPLDMIKNQEIFITI
jgi:hypothetical protein